MQEAVLRQRAPLAIENDVIPNRPPDRLRGGFGAGTPCVICELPVTTNVLEYEIQFARNWNDPSDRTAGGRDFQVFHLHLHCFSAFDVERTV